MKLYYIIIISIVYLLIKHFIKKASAPPKKEHDENLPATEEKEDDIFEFEKEYEDEEEKIQAGSEQVGEEFDRAQYKDTQKSMEGPGLERASLEDASLEGPTLEGTGLEESGSKNAALPYEQQESQEYSAQNITTETPYRIKHIDAEPYSGTGLVFSPDELEQAIIMKEIIGPPKAARFFPNLLKNK